MESVLVGLYPTPTRANSAGPSSPRQNPMEDSHPSRKRPRLGSGNRPYRSMSADRITTPPPIQNIAHAPFTIPRHEIHSRSFEQEKSLQPPERTPSKVTINVREPAQNESPTIPHLNGMQSRSPMEQDSNHVPVQNESLDQINSKSSNVISVSSSPSRSPEIEVAEVEDISQEPGETKWIPLVKMMDAKSTQAALLDDFPNVDRRHHMKQAVISLCQKLERNSLEDGTIFKNLADWIEMYLLDTEPFDSQWWDMYLDEREFWDELPATVETLLRRTGGRFGAALVLPARNDDDPDEFQEFESSCSRFQSFLIAYTALAVRMARIDCQTLDECASDINIMPDLISIRYLSNVLALVTTMASSLWRTLHDEYLYDYKPTISAVISRFVSHPSGGIKHLSHIVKGLLDRSQSIPALVPKIWAPLQLAHHLIQQFHSYSEANDEVHKNLLQHASLEAYEMFQVIDVTLQTFVTKQVSVLSLEMSQRLVQNLSQLLLSIARADPDLTDAILRKQLNIRQRLEPSDGPVVVELAWKFNLLKKCIMEGRMEIRVQGVDTMQQELVAIYNKYLRNPAAYKDHPVAQFLSDFMLDNRLVDYFVGVESHPQLINRCENIIGFLVITARYSEAQSDAIWKVVTTSQDSRVVDAILHMLIGFFNISPYETLLYLTQKLNELPMQAFDGSLVVYGRSLLDHLRRTWREMRLDRKLDMPPYDLCIRLIRQAAAERARPAHKNRDIHAFALTELQSLLTLGPSEADRKIIYSDCIRDVSCKTECSAGSISAINALLGQNPEEDIRMLANESNLTNLMIEQLAQITDEKSISSSTPPVLDEGLTVHLELLQSIITYIPDTITPEAGKRLWDVMLNHDVLSDRARHSAWTILVRATRDSSKRNSFIDRCIRNYLPQLNPSLITAGCLSFVQQATQYESRMADLHLDAEQHGVSPVGGELLWHLALIAPSGRIGLQAIHMLVALYLDAPKTLRVGQTALEVMQIDVVERCIRQLKDAASLLKSYLDGSSSGEDEPMVVVVDESEIERQRTSFARSLLILKEFVQGVRSRPRYSPVPSGKQQLPPRFREIKGDSFHIRYQSFSGGTHTGIHSIEVGDLETIEDLTQRLISLTGFEKFTAIAGGQKLDLTNESSSTLRDLKFDQKGLLIVKKANDSTSLSDIGPSPELRPLELEVMKNFQELHQFLSMEERLAKEVFAFLTAFPPHESVTSLVCSDDIQLALAFPPAAPFKILYSIFALKVCLTHQLQNGTASQEFIKHGVQILTTTLISSRITTENLGSDIDLSIAAGLVDCLLQFLKEPSLSEVAHGLFPDDLAFVNSLQSLISSATKVSGAEASKLICNSFAALLEASLYNVNVWNSFKSMGQCGSLFRTLLLENSKQEVRQGIVDSIRGICCTLPQNSATPFQDFILFFWDTLVALIPESLHHGETSQQFFDTTSFVFRAIDETSRAKLDLTTYTTDWSRLLLKHSHDEFVGRDSIDWVVFGIADLLHWCIQLTKSLKKPLETEHDLVGRIFRSHMFPEISNFGGDIPIKAKVPPLHTQTRQELYSIILALSHTMPAYESLIKLVRDLLPQGDYTYDTNWNFERSKSIRSPTGYPGLRNLSNTCYLNSLFTQLFMNVGFRGFMLNTNIADGNSSQKLLSETKYLFAYMQESMLRSVDPQGIADSLVTYDNTLIDVSIQMDVDEFYNLLFDRWESQILSDTGKKKFRAFYGGQIVQQIKSKECPHISERLEPFSAIQCDIQGKATLIESLNAYVGGEVMEGDNKYSCTSCGCYVDAVKRACFKDIPDNLIFHLKRFDYDVMTGMRSKINDRFDFPQMIDMSPYHVDYLKDPGQPTKPDIFELVGILVHTGTAESGHYYSYIRERPSPPSQSPNWIEFNDADVSRFDPANIPDQCFGGPGDNSPFSPVRFAKAWNAYMLFYQRVRAMEAECQSLTASTAGSPPRNELPQELSNQIAVENEIYIRKYCLFDPAHAVFARSLLEQLRLLTKGTCSDDHEIEKQAISLALEHLDQILSRPKDSSGFDKMLTSLVRLIGTCSNCCKLALDWVIDHKYALRNLLLKCPTAKVRRDFSDMLMTALRHLRKYEPQLYGFDIDEVDSNPIEYHYPETGGALQGIVVGLREFWTSMHCFSRAWDDYFGLLADVAGLGVPEAHVLLREDFLKGCLEILILENYGARKLRVDYPHYGSIFRLIEKGRKFSLAKLIEVVRNLLVTIDLELNPLDIQHPRQRPLENGKMMLTGVEEKYMRFNERSKHLIFLEKILSSEHNIKASKDIVRTITLAEPTFGALQDITNTILSGINLEPASLAAPYLAVALTFCESAPMPGQVTTMITAIARDVDTIGVNGGREHLDFFSQARRIRNLRIRSPQHCNRMVLHTVPSWAPALIMYWEESVRTGTIDLLKTLVFDRDTQNMDDEEEAEEIERIAKELCQACVKRIREHIIQHQKAVETRSVESVVQVIRHCVHDYFQDGAIEDDRGFVQEAEVVLQALQTLMVVDAEDVISDGWGNGDSDMNTDDSGSETLMSP